MIRNLFVLLLLISASVFAQPPDSTNPYIRKAKKGAVNLELGMNSVASLVGLKGTFYVKPRIPIDLGIGILSTTGLRPGIQARYLFSNAKFAGFGYSGLKYGIGTGNQDIKFEDPEDKRELWFRVLPSAFFDLGLGFDYLAHNGFNFIGTFGWSTLMGSKNYKWTKSSIPSKKAVDAIKFVLGSGPALSFSAGYAF